MVAYSARPSLGGLGAAPVTDLRSALSRFAPPTVAKRVATLPPPTLSPAARTAIEAVDAALAEARTRVSTATVAELDGKTPCPTGAWADDVSKGKANDLDPNHCLSYGGPWISPMAEVPGVTCANARILLWADIADRAQGALRTLLSNRPASTSSGEDQYLWYRSVLSACTLIGVASNVNPRDFTVALDPRADDAKPFGKYAHFNEAQRRANDLGKSVVDAIESSTGRLGAQFIALPVVCPTYVAVADEFNRAEQDRIPYSGLQQQLGWNDERTYAESLYRKLIVCEPRAMLDFDGFRGVNAGQCSVFRTTRTGWDSVFSLDTTRLRWLRSEREMGKIVAAGFFGRGFAMPYASMDAAASTSNEVAGSILRTNTTTREADGRMRQIFISTAGNPGHMTRGFFLSRTYEVGGAPPVPARMAEHYQQCWAPTARYYMDLAEIWGRAFLQVNFVERIGSALKSYGFRIKRLIRVLGSRGVDITQGTVKSVEQLIRAANEVRTAGYSAAAGGAASVISLMAGAGAFAGSGGPITVAITIAALVVMALVFAFIELLKWNQSPREERGEDDWSLVLDTFFLRSPPLSDACAANPEAGLDIMDRGFNADRGAGAPFAEIAQGRNPTLPGAGGGGAGGREKREIPWKTLLLAGGAVALVALAARR